MKRIFLFLATNLAILLVLGVFLNVFSGVLGISQGTTSSLLFFAIIFGMGGAFISLAISKPVAKWSTGARVIKNPQNEKERWLLDTVAKQARQVGIGMPEVAIYDATEINAFATGMNRNNAMVAVSTGLLRKISHSKVEAVLAHEVSHVANGDMVTLALIQGVLNTFVIVIARLLGGLLDNLISNRDEENEGGGLVYHMIVFVLEIVFGVLASVIVMWFSRQREFRADQGGARLAGRQKMIAALEDLRDSHSESFLPQEVAALGISGREGWSRLFMTHPPLEERIASLKSQKR
ncbi:MAG: protease HtpX [Magnetococcales bacterium]|nr:protease HtpX [Magnetococcales bacterium]